MTLGARGSSLTVRGFTLPLQIYTIAARAVAINRHNLDLPCDDVGSQLVLRHVGELFARFRTFIRPSPA
jgi:hypothetical protein